MTARECNSTERCAVWDFCLYFATEKARQTVQSDKSTGHIFYSVGVRHSEETWHKKKEEKKKTAVNFKKAKKGPEWRDRNLVVLVFKVLNVQSRCKGTLRQHLCFRSTVPQTNDHWVRASFTSLSISSHLWQCGPFERILQWEWWAGEGPAGTYADHRTGWEVLTDPGLMKEDLKVQSNTRHIFKYKNLTSVHIDP